MAYNYPYYYPTRRYPNYNYNYSKYYRPPYSSEIEKNVEEEKDFKNTCSSNVNSCITTYEKEPKEECFEIFGIKLFFDDILLICLIFFLYNEGVKDQYLFISLILLLLS